MKLTLSLLSQFIPGVYKTRSTGPDAQLSWGLNSVADFMQETDLRVRKGKHAATATATVAASAEGLKTRKGKAKV